MTFLVIVGLLLFGVPMLCVATVSPKAAGIVLMTGGMIVILGGVVICSVEYPWAFQANGFGQPMNYLIYAGITLTIVVGAIVYVKSLLKDSRYPTEKSIKLLEREVELNTKVNATRAALVALLPDGVIDPRTGKQASNAALRDWRFAALWWTQDEETRARLDPRHWPPSP